MKSTLCAVAVILSVFVGLPHAEAKDIHTVVGCMSKPLQVKIFYAFTTNDPTKDNEKINAWLASVGEMYLVKTLQTHANDMGMVITSIYRRCD
jgi:hypothetical protein